MNGRITGSVESTDDEYERCIVCGKCTEIRRDETIEKRLGYIEGCGQLCRECWLMLYSMENGE